MEEKYDGKLLQYRMIIVGIYTLGIIIGIIMIMYYMKGDRVYSAYSTIKKYMYVFALNVFIASLVGLFSLGGQLLLHIYEKSALFLLILIIVDFIFWGIDCMGVMQDTSKVILSFIAFLVNILFYVLYYSLDNISYALHFLLDIQEYQKDYTLAINSLNNKIEKYNDSLNIIKESIDEFCPEMSIKDKFIKAFKGEGFEKEIFVDYNDDCNLRYRENSLILLNGWGASNGIRKKYSDCKNKLIGLTNKYRNFEKELDARIKYYRNSIQLIDDINKYGENAELKEELVNYLKVLLNDVKGYKYKKISI